MQRILIIGNGGAGKTWLAQRLSRRIGLPVIHLDQHFWKPGWQKPGSPQWEEKVDALTLAPGWIMDGTYTSTLDQRLAHADMVILLSPSRWKCLQRILWRRLRYHGRTRPDLTPNCPERLTWEFIHYVYSFPNQREPLLRGKLAARASKKKIVILRNNREVKSFLNSMPSEGRIEA